MFQLLWDSSYVWFSSSQNESLNRGAVVTKENIFFVGINYNDIADQADEGDIWPIHE